MKKLLFPVIIIILIFCLLLSSCGKKTEEAEDAVVDEPIQQLSAEAASLTLNMQLFTEEDTPCAADKIKITTKSGKSFTADISDGVFAISGLPYESGMKAVLTQDKSIIAEFTISFWTGFNIDYHNNLNTLSIDIPGNTGEVYLKAVVRKDNAKVTCEFVSQYSFDAEAQAEEGGGYDIDEETAVAAGLYGIKYATATGLNLRSEPSTESTSVRKLNFGDQLSLMNSGEDVDGQLWYKVQYNGEDEGYVSGDYLGKKFVVNKNGVNVRKSPSAEGELIYAIGEGTVVIAVDDGTKDGDYKWYHIFTRDGHEGYIRNDFLTLS